MKRSLRKAHSARFAWSAMALTWAAASALRAQNPPTYTAIPIGDLGVNPDGIGTSSVAAFNANGEVVGFSEQYDGSGDDLGPEAIIYNNGIFTGIGNLGASSGVGDSYAVAVNASGVVIGNSEAYDSSGDDLGQQGFIYQGGTLTSIGVLAEGSDGTGASQAIAVNNSGIVIGTSELYDSSQ